MLGVTLVVNTVGCSFVPPYAAAATTPAAGLAAPDSWFFFSVNLRPSVLQLAQADRLTAAFTSQPGFDAAVRQLEQLNPSSSQQNFARDILPLLDGEVAVAASGPVTGAEPHIAVIAHSSDPNRLLGFEQAVPSRTQPATPRPGATVYQLAAGGVGVAYKGWALISDNLDELAPLLDRIDASGKGGLADQQRFRSVIERLPTERVGYTYIDTATLISILSNEGAGVASRPDLEQRLHDASGRAALSFALASDGVELRAESTLDAPTSGAVGGSGDALEALSMLPADTLAAVAGNDLPRLVAQTQTEADSQALGEVVPAGAQEVLASLGDWLSGEFAAGVSAGSLDEPDGQPNVFLIAGVGDEDLASQSLDAIQGDLPPKSVYQVDVAGRTLNQVVLEPGQTLTYGVADSWLYVVSGDAEGVLEASDAGGLGSNPRYRMVADRLTGNGTDVFLDLEAIRLLLERQALGSELLTYRRTVEPFLAPLRAFGGGTQTDANGDSHSRLFLAIR
jgi:hypothetical protein